MTEGKFQSKGRFSVYVVKTEVKVPIKLKEEAGGFNAEWPVYIQVKNQKRDEVLSARKERNQSRQALFKDLNTSFQNAAKLATGGKTKRNVLSSKSQLVRLGSGTADNKPSAVKVEVARLTLKNENAEVVRFLVSDKTSGDLMAAQLRYEKDRATHVLSEIAPNAPWSPGEGTPSETFAEFMTKNHLMNLRSSENRALASSPSSSSASSSSDSE